MSPFATCGAERSIIERIVASKEAGSWARSRLAAWAATAPSYERASSTSAACRRPRRLRAARIRRRSRMSAAVRIHEHRPAHPEDVRRELDRRRLIRLGRRPVRRRDARPVRDRDQVHIVGRSAAAAMSPPTSRRPSSRLDRLFAHLRPIDVQRHALAPESSRAPSRGSARRFRLRLDQLTRSLPRHIDFRQQSVADHRPARAGRSPSPAPDRSGRGRDRHTARRSAPGR